tara:strand:+ start:16939 stop:17193 length:255 start_codon:yes stop_codon:yes gene_type:complete
VANNKSAIKRIRQNEKARLRNRLVMVSMRTAIKKARAAVDTSAENAAELIKVASSSIDRAVTKGALKRTTASRYISRLTSRKTA